MALILYRRGLMVADGVSKAKGPVNWACERLLGRSGWNLPGIHGNSAEPTWVARCPDCPWPGSGGVNAPSRWPVPKSGFDDATGVFPPGRMDITGIPLSSNCSAATATALAGPTESAQFDRQRVKPGGFPVPRTSNQGPKTPQHSTAGALLIG